MGQTAATQPDVEPAERIFLEAARLFAEKGFKGVTTREIAAAVDLNIATVHYHVGTKQELYGKIYERLCAEERCFLSDLMEYVGNSALPESPDLRDLARRLIDRTVDFVAQDPVRVRFMVRHWLEGGRYAALNDRAPALAPYEQVEKLLRMAEAEGTTHLPVEPGLFLRGFFGILYSYFAFRSFSWEDDDRDPHEPANVEALKAFLHSYVARMLGL
jgi:AcrR family transcriptional regulator